MLDTIGFTTHRYQSKDHYKGISIGLNTKDLNEEKIVTLEYDADKGLRALLYDNPNHDSEPTIIDLNDYLRQEGVHG